MTELEFIDIFADNLESLMEEAGMSKATLAKETGLSKSTVGRYFTRECMPTARAIMNICYVLDCGFDDLLPMYELVE